MKDIILFKEEGILALYKEKGISTVPLKNNINEDTLLKRVSLIYPEILCVNSPLSWEGGILNRLDKKTDGIVLAALSDASYSFMKDEMKNGGIIKRYYAKIENMDRDKTFPIFPFHFASCETIHSFFKVYGRGRKEVRPVLEKHKDTTKYEYSTKILSILKNEVFCEISKGFRHQIRCHLSWSGHPIVGDDIYGNGDGDILFLSAKEYIFRLPSGKCVDIKI